MCDSDSITNSATAKSDGPLGPERRDDMATRKERHEMPNMKAGSSEHFQKGDDMESIGQSAERLRIVLSSIGLNDEQARRLYGVVGVDELTRRLNASDDADEFLATFSQAEVKALIDIILWI